MSQTECWPHAQVVRIENDVLALAVSSSAWRARVHYHHRQILKFFQSRVSPELKQVDIRVVPMWYETRKSSRLPPAPLPAGTARHLEGLAEQSGHEGLSASLRKLARRKSGKD